MIIVEDVIQHVNDEIDLQIIGIMMKLPRFALEKTIFYFSIFEKSMNITHF